MNEHMSQSHLTVNAKTNFTESVKLGNVNAMPKMKEIFAKEKETSLLSDSQRFVKILHKVAPEQVILSIYKMWELSVLKLFQEK